MKRYKLQPHLSTGPKAPTGITKDAAAGKVVGKAANAPVLKPGKSR